MKYEYKLQSHEDRPCGMITIPSDRKMESIKTRLKRDEAIKKKNEPYILKYNIKAITQRTVEQMNMNRTKQIFVNGEKMTIKDFQEIVPISDQYFRYNAGLYSEFMVNDYHIANIYIDRVPHRRVQDPSVRKRRMDFVVDYLVPLKRDSSRIKLAHVIVNGKKKTLSQAVKHIGVSENYYRVLRSGWEELKINGYHLKNIYTLRSKTKNVTITDLKTGKVLLNKGEVAAAAEILGVSATHVRTLSLKNKVEWRNYIIEGKNNDF